LESLYRIHSAKKAAPWLCNWNVSALSLKPYREKVNVLISGISELMLRERYWQGCNAKTKTKDTTQLPDIFFKIIPDKQPSLILLYPYT
jgi:hypothetical protein